ncbi:MAG: nucleoside diphosphate kinase regulator [Sedimenticola sp.]|jgi:regulator of nucleoside diphosphate kinase|nr:MAG: nucleoside diphosphate kinase regulator [Sedimenticola sp.]
MNTRSAIIITSQDLDRLEALLDSLADDIPGKEELQTELDRAEVLPPAQIPDNVVTMNSEVLFSVDGGGEFCLTLVYPKDINGGTDRISVLAPVGSALLGLSTGERIEWPKPGGGMMKLQIKEVLYQPEREGEFHR